MILLYSPALSAVYARFPTTLSVRPVLAARTGDTANFVGIGPDDVLLVVFKTGIDTRLPNGVGVTDRGL